ncbi:hypothetical protein N5E96_12205 [Pseudomonas mosselii]|uniref:hypothetical protein n=1 Tax=Pseudomonas mosselii TaxID=78327 RepID=UPI0024499684|nr:hypothetical protein [Pseudomonas mosselii]MDH1656576.1 hypothetical protein [Pseudomonas mosselii]MDH1718000.1 hypothetical protein [Pseudomonas mosselii]MDH1722046.1 hypothetical protein [Pseudomonas mosselii]
MDYPKRIPNVGLVGGKFVDENVSTGLPGSLIPSAWGNAVTDELLAVIKAAGLTPSEDDNAQLLQAIQGLAASDVKRAVRVATTGPIALSGLQTIDGVALAAGDRVLVKDQANASQNWIYNAAAGAWVRALDANDNAECTPGHLIIVQAGATYAGSMWQLTNTAPPQVGTTALTFAQLFGKTGVVAGSYRQVSVDALGRVTGGSNPTTLGGYGIGDAYTRTQVDSALSGKANKATTLAGYGITDAQPAAQILADFVSTGGWGLGQGSPKYVNDGNAAILPGFYSAGGADSTNFGDAYSPMLVMRRAAGNVGQQQINARDNEFLFRGSADDGVSWKPWVKVWHSGNLVKNTSQTDATPGSILRNGDHGIGGQAVSTEVDLAKYRTGGKFITPASGLVGLPAGWVQGRHVIEVAGGDGYCVQRLTGANVNKGWCAYRVWDGAWAAWDEVLTTKRLAVAEATLQDLVDKVSSSTYVSPRRLAEIAFGSGQSPVNVTGSKVWNTSYVNSTNKTIFVSIHVKDGAGGSGALSASLYIANELWAKAYLGGGSETTLEGPVPPGGSYGIFREDTNDLIVKWTEYR